MPRTELTLEEKNVILNFYENTTAETSVRKMAMLFSEKFGKNVSKSTISRILQRKTCLRAIKSVSKLRVRSRKYRARLTFLMNWNQNFWNQNCKSRSPEIYLTNTSIVVRFQFPENFLNRIKEKYQNKIFREPIQRRPEVLEKIQKRISQRYLILNQSATLKIKISC